jgi:hypothetical protein
LVVTRLDRLARSTFDLLNIVKSTAAKDANFLSLAEPWANTSTAIGKLMLTVLSGVAEFERDLILLRTNEGRQRARQSGIKFGPKFKLSAHQIEEIRRRREAGESCRFLGRSYGVSANTISRVRWRLRRLTKNSGVRRSLEASSGGLNAYFQLIFGGSPVASDAAVKWFCSVPDCRWTETGVWHSDAATLPAFLGSAFETPQESCLKQ